MNTNINIIIVEESNKQYLNILNNDFSNVGFTDNSIKYSRIIRTDRVEDIISIDEIDFDDDINLFKKFFIRYKTLDEGTVYIYCHGDFREFAKLLLTGGEFKK